MKQISITYNPYLISTDIKVDGESPKSDSALIVGKKRLQEWVEKLPQIIIEGYSYKTLVENYGMKPIGAFLTLDWLIREPQKALTSLKKGIK